MSFRCDNCNKAQEDGVQPTKVVTKTRPQTYPERYKENSQGGKPIKIDNGGKGREIVEEKALCPSCLMALLEQEVPL